MTGASSRRWQTQVTRRRRRPERRRCTISVTRDAKKTLRHFVLPHLTLECSPTPPPPLPCRHILLRHLLAPRPIRPSPRLQHVYLSRGLSRIRTGCRAGEINGYSSTWTRLDKALLRVYFPQLLSASIAAGD
jgi:hypothetical protein